MNWAISSPTFLTTNSSFRVKTCLAAALHLYLVAAASAQSDHRVLSDLTTALERYKSAEVSGEVRTELGGTANEGKSVESNQLTIRRLGSRAILSMKTTMKRPGKTPVHMQTDFLLSESGDILNLQTPLDDHLAQVQGVTPQLGAMLYSKRLAGEQLIDADGMFSLLNDAGAILWVIGYAPLTDYLKDSTPVVTATSTGATIRSLNKYGEVKLEVSKGQGWLPSSFSVVKKPSHLTYGGLVRDTYGSDVTQVSWEGLAKDYEAVGGNSWAPSEMKIVRKVAFTSGKQEITTTEIRSIKTNFEPTMSDEDFKSKIELPVGHAVTVVGAPHLPYKWDGENAVPAVPHGGEINPLAAGWSSPRLWLIAANIIFVAICVVVLVRRRQSIANLNKDIR